MLKCSEVIQFLFYCVESKIVLIKMTDIEYCAPVTHECFFLLKEEASLVVSFVTESHLPIVFLGFLKLLHPHSSLIHSADIIFMCFLENWLRQNLATENSSCVRGCAVVHCYSIKCDLSMLLT